MQVFGRKREIYQVVRKSEQGELPLRNVLYIHMGYPSLQYAIPPLWQGQMLQTTINHTPSHKCQNHTAKPYKNLLNQQMSFLSMQAKLPQALKIQIHNGYSQAQQLDEIAGLPRGDQIQGRYPLLQPDHELVIEVTCTGRPLDRISGYYSHLKVIVTRKLLETNIT